VKVRWADSSVRVKAPFEGPQNVRRTARSQHYHYISRKAITLRPFIRQERGISIILFTLVSILVLLPMIGLAIDGSILFWTKAKLTSALDAAALAAGRSPSIDPSFVAQQYVYANLPPGWLGCKYTAGPTAMRHPFGETPTLFSC
jgi:hypothetical protein